MQKVIVMLAAALCLCWSGTYAGDGTNTMSSFRCGNDVVNPGDSKFQVILRCGDPSYREEEGVSEKGGRGLEAARHAYMSRTVIREKWHYNRGPNDFIYVLTFEGDTLKTITESGYGR